MYRRGILREYASLFGLAQRAVDVMALVVAALVAHWMRFGVSLLREDEQVALLLAALVCLWSFEHMGLYRSWRDARLIQEIGLMLMGWTGSFVALTAVGFALKASGGFSRTWVGLWFVLGALLLVALRIVLRTALRVARARGYNTRQVVIAGAGQAASHMCTYLLDHPTLGLRVHAALGLAGDCSWADPRVATRLPMDALNAYMAAHTVDEVWIALPLGDKTQLLSLLHTLRHRTANVRYIADTFSFNLLNHSVTELGGQPIVNLALSPMEGMASIAKRLEDIILGGIILALTSPLMLLIAIGVKLTSPGPVFYRQERVGWQSRCFHMLKFRTMPVDSEAAGVRWGAKGKQPTRFGSFLRRTSLDEIPQFINVLMGDMSIVGPRPERPMFVDQFKDNVPLYMKKHLVKAGITGWAQIHGWRGDTDLNQRIQHDLHYINNWSILLDLKIIMLTIFKGFRHRNAY